LAVAAVALCTAAADAPSDRAFVIAAIADDVQAVVIRDASMQPVAYTIGETVQGTLWRLTKVSQGEVTLRNARPYKGATLEVRLQVGQRLESDVFVEAGAFVPAERRPDER
jgi:hypothetical protein